MIIIWAHFPLGLSTNNTYKYKNIIIQISYTCAFLDVFMEIFWEKITTTIEFSSVLHVATIENNIIILRFPVIVLLGVNYLTMLFIFLSLHILCWLCLRGLCFYLSASRHAVIVCCSFWGSCIKNFSMVQRLHNHIRMLHFQKMIHLNFEMIL